MEAPHNQKKCINLSKVASLIKRFILPINKIKRDEFALKNIFPTPNKLKQTAFTGGLPCKIYMHFCVFRLALLLPITIGTCLLPAQPGYEGKYFMILFMPENDYLLRYVCNGMNVSRQYKIYNPCFSC